MRPADIPVVAVGASAGGLDPIGRFLAAMPADSGLAFVVIQHLDPASESILPELLSKHTAMPVRSAVDGAALAANVVHVIPPGSELSVAAGRLVVSAVHVDRGLHREIDWFLHALAADRGPLGIGIVMSGTGTDGALGLKALKEAGGLTLVQDPAEAQQDGMPRHAMVVARPDHAIPVAEMPAMLLRYLQHGYVKTWHPGMADEEVIVVPQPTLASLVEVLRSATGHDFASYKPATLQRRVDRRMALHGIDDLARYLVLLRDSPAEADAMAQDLLINVTRFFRDPEAFAALADRVLPELLRQSGDRLVRIWVAGCSTGEEAYSLGILFMEQLAAANRRAGLQVFATDIDDAALQIARSGLYPETIQADVSPERLARFFIREDRRFRVGKELRQAVIFSRHDLLQDPPFSRLDLVSCRNLLIYLRPDAQRRALALFHFALRNQGMLVLGSAESAGAAGGLFEPMDEKLRLYRRLAHRRPARLRLPVPDRGRHAEPSGMPASPAPPRQPSLGEVVQRTLLEQYAPAAVVTNRQFMPLHYAGPTDRYLGIVPGDASQDILSMAREGLRPALHDAVTRAFRSRRRVALHGVRFKRDGRPAVVTVEAVRLADEHDDVVLLSFIDEPQRLAEAAGPPDRMPVDASAPAELRRQLADTTRELNRTIHEVRRANDALKVKNEEAMSLNEEFLSTNEELESSKEELQSLNEELTTINSQLRVSLEQQQTSTDLTNLLNSSAVATILLDADLRIKIFNPPMKALFALIDSDVGRPLGDLLPKFADPQLLADVILARSQAARSTREIRAESGAWYSRSVLPYRTEDGAVEGAVVTFTDVSGLKQAELAAAAARAYSETIIDTIHEPLAVLDPELRVVSVNAAFLAAFDLPPEHVVGQGVRDVGPPVLAHGSLGNLLRQTVRRQAGTDRIELTDEQPNGEYRLWRATARPFRVPPDERPMALLALEDITDERRIVRRQLQLMIDTLPGAFLAVGQDRRIRFVSRQVEALFGYAADELVGRTIDMLLPPDTRERHAGLHADFLANPVRRAMGSELNIRGVAKDGSEVPLDVGLSPMPTADGMLVVAAIHDLRAQKRGEEQLRDAKAAAERAKSRFLAAASHDLRQPLQTVGLLHGVLARRIVDPDLRAVLVRLDETVATMADLLDALLDVNQIEGGGVTPDIAEFPVAALLARAGDDFAPLAAAKGLELRVVPTSLRVRSDRRLLARMVGNLLSNAIKYTDSGRVLLGCRRRGDDFAIEVWDTGIGIPADRVDAVFEEFYRLDRNDSGRFGLGLGLYIVQRFAQLLGHRVEVRSRPARGTMFALVVPGAGRVTLPPAPASADGAVVPTILLVEDDPAQLDTLRMLLEMDGYRVVTARRGDEALARLRQPGTPHPDAVVADYNLPGGTTGLQMIQNVRTELGASVPAIVVTGDKSAAVLQAVEAAGQAVLVKPVKAAELSAAVEMLIRAAVPDWPGAEQRRPAALAPMASGFDIAIVDDDQGVREALRMMLESEGYKVTTFASAELFLAAPARARFRLVVADLSLPGMDGLALQARLRAEQDDPPVIFVTGGGDLPMAVRAMRAGAADFLQKPIRSAELRDAVARVLEAADASAGQRLHRGDADARLATLTEREREIVELMLHGQLTKQIAAELGISQRTAEHHRQNAMRKMGTKSFAALVRLIGLGNQSG